MESKAQTEMVQVYVLTIKITFVFLFLHFRDGQWIDACNTSHHSCNIFSIIDDPSSPLWARVKARLGQEESVYAQSREFILCKEGEWNVYMSKFQSYACLLYIFAFISSC